MKTLVVFYSLTENTAKEAERVAEALGATTLRLYAQKAYPDKGFKKFLWGGKSAVMGEKPALVPYTIDLSEYDLVLFGTPVTGQARFVRFVAHPTREFQFLDEVVIN